MVRFAQPLPSHFSLKVLISHSQRTFEHNEEDERAAKKPRFEDEDFGGPSASQTSNPSLSRASNDIASPSSPSYAPNTEKPSAPVSLMGLEGPSDVKDSTVHNNEVLSLRFELALPFLIRRLGRLCFVYYKPSREPNRREAETHRGKIRLCFVN